jgi:excinuclease UvrABC nuclease subunit
MIENKDNNLTITVPTIDHLDKVVEIFKLPQESGIYFVFNNKDELCYIGQSKNIKNRIRTHHTINRDNYQVPINELCSYSYYLISDSLLMNVVEHMYIAFYKPRYNLIKEHSRWVTGYEFMTPGLEKAFRQNKSNNE